MTLGDETSGASPSSSLPKKIICVGDIFAAPFYIALTTVALFSVCVPVLRDLSAHGKTRLNAERRQEQQNFGIGGERRKKPALLRRLSSDLLLVRKRRFLQFYVAGIAVTLLLFLLRRVEDQLYVSPVESHHKFGPQGLAVALLMMHLTRRCYECLYVHEWTETDGSSGGASTMHAAGYALGVLHYVVLPFVFLGSDGDHDWCCEFADPPPGEENVVRGDMAEANILWGWGGGGGGLAKLVGLIGGAGLVLIGQAEQYRHHRILGDLRRGGAPKNDNGNVDGSDYSATSSYRIPIGRCFKYVSCPHYLAEILIYAGFALLLHACPRAPYHDLRCNLSSSVFGQLSYGMQRSGTVHVAFNLALNLEEYKHIALLVWVVTNLSISAMRNHAWYQRRFGDRYPRRRKALIPFLW